MLVAVGLLHSPSLGCGCITRTAATFWCSGAVEAFSGSRLYPEAAALTTLVMAGNTLLRPLVNWINRRPITAAVTEAEYWVHVVCAPAEWDRMRVVDRAAASDHDAHVASNSLLDGGTEFGADALVHHGEQVVRGVARCHAQVTLRRSQGVEALVVAAA